MIKCTVDCTITCTIICTIKCCYWLVNGGVCHGVNDGVNDGVSDDVNDGVNEGAEKEIIELVNILMNNECIRISDLVAKRGKSSATIERYLNLARQFDTIEVSGPPKIRGYFITKSLMKE